MAMEVNESGVFTLPIDIDSDGIVKKTLKTAGTYVDKNVEITITTPDAELEMKSAGSVIAKAGTTDTKYTSDTKTAYPITLTADATVGAVQVGVKTPGFVESSDLVTVAGASAPQNTKTVYIKAGSITGSNSASASGTGVNLTAAGGTKPTSGYYITATASGSAKVGTSGYVDSANNGAVTLNSTNYYTIPTASLNNAETTGRTYTTQHAPVLVSGKGLYINEGYIKDTYISLADLVPDEATVTADQNNLIYKTVSAYDKDGTLIAGTMGDATLSAITASNAKASIGTLRIAPTIDKTSFTVSGTGAISGSANVAIASTGYATTSLKQSGTISGTATVGASLPKIGLKANASKTNLTVTPIISKETSTTAKSSTITATKPTSGYYVAVSTAAIGSSASVIPAVSTNGYGTTEVNTATATTITGGANGSGIYYVPITNGSSSLTKGTPSVTNASTVISTAIATGEGGTVEGVLTTKPTTGSYITINTSSKNTAGSVSGTVTNTTSEGYITAKTDNQTISGSVNVVATQAATKYIKIYNGELLE